MADKATIQLPGDIGERLTEAAHARAVGRNLLAALILSDWLDNQPDPSLMVRAVRPREATDGHD